jgi:FkbM family methyltransferase
MNWLNKIYPLWLREKAYFHLIKCPGLPVKDNGGFNLEFAPVKMSALLPTDYCHRQIAYTGFYELDLSRRIASLAKEGGLMVDVGANAGYFSCIWAALNLHNEVYSFEPSPRNLSMLRQNVSALPNPQRVHIVEQAASKETGTLSFDIGPEDQSGWGGFSNSASARTIHVQTGRLDDLIPPNTNVSLLKIDTEGADTWVLMGAENLLKQKRIKRVFFESNPSRMQLLGIQADEASSFLADVGYQMYPIGEQEFAAEPK